jgi:hypothetical protein
VISIQVICSSAVVYLLGLITCRMFRSCSEGLVIVGWIRLIFIKQDVFKYIHLYVACSKDPIQY